MTRLEPGVPAPDFTLTDDTGASVSLSDFRGRQLILYFYPKAMTPGCTTQACDFTESLDALQAQGYLQEALRDEGGKYRGVQLTALDGETVSLPYQRSRPPRA